jgi:hypothetical protein
METRGEIFLDSKNQTQETQQQIHESHTKHQTTHHKDATGLHVLLEMRLSAVVVPAQVVIGS